MSSFAEIIAGDQEDFADFFSTNAAGDQLKVWFPSAPGVKPAAFPNAILTLGGTTTQADRDLLRAVDRKKKQFTVSVATASLPAAFRNGIGDTIPKQQVIKLGRSAETAVSFLVTASRSSAGITEMDLEVNA